MKMTSRHIKSSNDFLKKNTKFSALGRFPRKGGGSLWFTHKDYAGSLNPRATSIPQSNHWVFHYLINHRLQQYTPQRGDFESHKAYSPPLPQHTPQARITLTLQDFTTSFTECNLNNYKKLRKGRKHLDYKRPETLWSVLETQQSSKAILLNLENFFSQTIGNLSNQSQIRV